MGDLKRHIAKQAESVLADVDRHIPLERALPSNVESVSSQGQITLTTSDLITAPLVDSSETIRPRQVYFYEV